MEYRLAYCGYGEVNWCEALGTVLANDEVINGVSERGGYPVVRKNCDNGICASQNMQTVTGRPGNSGFQRSDERNAEQLDRKSYGAEIDFEIAPSDNPKALKAYQN